MPLTSLHENVRHREHMSGNMQGCMYRTLCHRDLQCLSEDIHFLGSLLPSTFDTFFLPLSFSHREVGLRDRGLLSLQHELEVCILKLTAACCCFFSLLYRFIPLGLKTLKLTIRLCHLCLMISLLFGKVFFPFLKLSSFDCSEFVHVNLIASRLRSFSSSCRWYLCCRTSKY